MRLSNQLPALGLLLGAASALPGAPSAPTLAPRADPTDLWVTVDTSGHPSTVTPEATTIDGTPTVLNAAPYDATGVVFTTTNNGEVLTSTGSAVAVATATSGAGSFLECRNPHGGPLSPFCLPNNNQTLYPGKTYYVTWDPTFFGIGTNTTVKVVGWYANATTSVLTTQAFTSGYVAAAWGFYQWDLDSSVLSSQGVSGINVTIMMASWAQNAPSSAWLVGPTVLVTYVPSYQQPPAKAPAGPALYIGLPVVLGFVALMLCGTCLWNRHSRRIGLGNIMSRGRGGYGVGKSRSQRMRREHAAEQKIHLMNRDPRAARAMDDNDDFADGYGYEDARPYEPPTHREYRRDDEEEVPPRWAQGANDAADRRPPIIDLPRRDSDALGSLAGTPTEDRRMDFNGNSFRDEMTRQQKERIGGL